VFLRRGFVSTSPNPKMEDPLVGCPRLLIQFIHSYPPYWRPFLYPQPEDAPRRGDRDPHSWNVTVQSNNCFAGSSITNCKNWMLNRVCTFTQNCTLVDPDRTPFYVGLPSAWNSVEGELIFLSPYVGGLLFGDSGRHMWMNEWMNEWINRPVVLLTVHPCQWEHC
jgi:hypothetical protein